MREYRQDSHTKSLVFWAILCTATAVVLFVHSGKIVNRPLMAGEIAAGVGCLMFGPVALTVYLVRARHVWVSVDPGRGIVVNGTRVIPWERIERVERRTPRLRKKSGPAQAVPIPETEEIGCFGCYVLAELGVLGGVLVAALFVFWLVFFAFVPLVIVPVLEVFAPFGDKITIHAGGKKLVLRDLRDADDFLRAVAPRVHVVEK